MSARARYIPLRLRVMMYIALGFLPLYAVVFAFDVRNERTSLDSAYAELVQHTEKHAVHSIKLVDSGIRAMEMPIEEELVEYLDMMKEAYEASGRNPEKMDLQALASRIHSNIGLYIVGPDGVIKYATVKGTVGIDFNKWGMGGFIQEVRRGRGIRYSRLDPAFVSGKPKKFGYMPSGDGKYVLEAGIDASEYIENVGGMNVFSALREDIEGNPIISGAAMYNREGFRLDLPGARADAAQEAMVKKAFKLRKDIAENGGRDRKYIFIDLSDKKYGTDPSVVLELKYDRKYIEAMHNKTLVQHMSRWGTMLLAGTLLAMFFAGRLISAPILEALGGVVKIASGDYRHRLNTRGIGELLLLEQAINSMALNVSEKTEALRDANEKLAASERRYRHLFEHAKEGIVLAEIATKKFRYANPEACAMLGYTEEELCSLRVQDVHPEEDLERVKEIFEAQAREEMVVGVEVPFKRKDGTVILVDITSSPVEVGGEWYLVGFMRDVTQRKRTEDEVLKLRKIESVGLLAGGIAHDFNNSLAAILGGIDYAADVVFEDREDAVEALRLAKKAILEARGLTKQLLTFSRGGAPVLKPGQVAGLLRDTCGFVLRGSSSRVQLALQDGLWDAELDRAQISQVVQNLLINADQAMPGGGVISVEAENVDVAPGAAPVKPGRYVRVRVSDAGPGIPSEILPKIFDPYYTTKRAGQGLGLASALSIIIRHKGNIIAESPAGGGAVFTFWLPASEQPAQPEQSEETAQQPCRGRLRILVMDDNAQILQIIKKSLTRRGNIVETAYDGAEAADMFAAAREAGKPFDIVVLDLTVPGGVGGVEALKRMKQTDPGVRAVVASGYSSDPVMADHKAWGFSGMVAKPFDMDELCSVMEQVMSGGGQA